MARMRFSLAPVKPNEYISLRQAQCLIALIKTRGTRRELAKEMGNSYRTIEIFLSSLREKFECRSREELIEKAQQCDWQEWERRIIAVTSHVISGLRRGEASDIQLS